MKKSVAIVVAIIIIVAVGGFLLINHKSSDNSANNSNSHGMNDTGMSSGSNSSSSNSSQPSSTDQVSIENFAFSPSDITVKKGTTVTWTNKDSTTHTVAETDGKDGPKSGDLTQGSSYTFTYTTAGTFKYHCSIHPDMTGTVTVTE